MYVFVFFCLYLVNKVGMLKRQLLTVQNKTNFKKRGSFLWRLVSKHILKTCTLLNSKLCSGVSEWLFVLFVSMWHCDRLTVFSRCPSPFAQCFLEIDKLSHDLERKKGVFSPPRGVKWAFQLEFLDNYCFIQINKKQKQSFNNIWKMAGPKLYSMSDT